VCVYVCVYKCVFLCVCVCVCVPSCDSLYLSLSLSTSLSLSGKFYLYSQLWVWSNVTGWGGNWSPRSVTTSGWTYINQFLGVFIYMWIFGEIVSLLQNFDLNGAEAKSEREKISRCTHTHADTHTLFWRDCQSTSEFLARLLVYFRISISVELWRNWKERRSIGVHTHARTHTYAHTCTHATK